MAQESNLGERLVLLAQQRAEKLKANRIKAKECVHSGDELTAAGSHLQASYFYADAVRLWTTNVDFHLKLATAYVQAKQFEQAALTATRALSMNPKDIEARYQRGMARLEQGLHLPNKDFETILTHHPTHAPSRNALARVQSCFPVGGTKAISDSVSSDLDFAFPGYDEVGLELVDVSDSEECGHVGNGVPCRFYNRNESGCVRGVGCKFKHAPDEKSVRDTLGRNVCLYYLLGSCKFGEVKCVYSHEKEWLPEKGWWNDSAQIERMKHLVEMAGRDAKEQRELGKLKQGSQGQEGRTGNGKKRHRFTRQKRGRGKPMRTEEDSDELEERMENFGFGTAELDELLCQGVKPWDDDAWDVLHALSI